MINKEMKKGGIDFPLPGKTVEQTWRKENCRCLKATHTLSSHFQWLSQLW